jgi:predicted nucleic acid-binding protein
MQLLIADAGPIIALSSIDHLFLLKLLYKQIVIPEAVHQEILAGGSKQLGLACYLNSDWIVVKKNALFNPALLSLLGAGEAQAILLAQTLTASTLLVDDLKARKIAVHLYQLPIIGTLGILKKAKENNLVIKAKPLVLGIQSHGYRFSQPLIEALLTAVNENKSD